MPPLPFELERQIFEIAALQDTNHNHRIQIILVAKRVKIRPILYRVVVIRNDLLETSGALNIHNWPNAQITNSVQLVRHLSVSYRRSHVLLEIISTFPNIENFASWGSTISVEIFKKMNQLPLRRLSLYFGWTSFHKAIEHCPVFNNLTHLEMVFSIVQDDFKHLPKLTHLSFAFSYGQDAAVLDFLKHCVSLRVLICFLTQGSGHSPTKLDDPRYLVLRDRMTIQDLVEEWAKSANGLVGCWELADVIIEARNSKLFKDTAPFVLSRRTWMEHLNDDGMQWYEEWSRGIRNGGAEPEEDPKVLQH